MQIKLTHILIENFKGIKHLEIDFGDTTHISGRNASGKTTISDAFSWLLFDKDSTGSSAFAIRPKDADGRDIDNIEIKVEAAIDADGEEITLTKIQKQRWTKHRGSTAPTFEGNVNEFMINGYPAKKNEYDQKIRSLIDENLFKLITNPRTFPAMKWQDQRKTLMEFVGDITDEDILNSDTEKYAPIREDVIAAGADKAREKAAITLRSLKKQQNEFPVRIDEAARNAVETMPEEKIKVLTEEAEEELKAVQDERSGLYTASNAINEIRDQIMQKRLKMDAIKRSMEYEKEKELGEAVSNKNAALTELRKVESQRDSLSDKKNWLVSSTNDYKSLIAELAADYRKTAAAQFPEEKTVCPTCGRPFDPEKIQSLKQEFKSKVAENLESLNSRGRDVRKKIDSQAAQIREIERQIEALTADIEAKDAEYKRLIMVARQKTTTEIDPTYNAEYIALKTEAEALEQKLASMDNDDSRKEDLYRREEAAKAKLAHAREEAAKIEANRKLQQRIEQLKEEQLDCGQKVADQEQVVYLLEEFTKAKMDLLSDRINGHFKKVRFKLFDTQINGAVKETCTMQINTNGSFVDYSDANNAAQILGGLDVIEALSTLYGVTAPIFLDNSESIDHYNTPEMDAQLILLEVSDDKELHVERG